MPSQWKKSWAWWCLSVIPAKEESIKQENQSHSRPWAKTETLEEKGLEGMV
jgi:hypothetical protein